MEKHQKPQSFENIETFLKIPVGQPCFNLIDAYNWIEVYLYHLSECLYLYDEDDKYRLEFLFMERIYDLLTNNQPFSIDGYQKVIFLPYLLHFRESKSKHNRKSKVLHEYTLSRTNESRDVSYRSVSIPVGSAVSSNTHELGQLFYHTLTQLEPAKGFEYNLKLFKLMCLNVVGNPLMFLWKHTGSDTPTSILIYNLYVYQLFHPDCFITSNPQISGHVSTLDMVFYVTNRTGPENLPIMEDFFDLEKQLGCPFFISNRLSEPDKDKLMKNFSPIYPKSRSVNLLSQREKTTKITNDIVNSCEMSYGESEIFMLDFVSLCVFVVESMKKLGLKKTAIIKYRLGMLGIGTGLVNYLETNMNHAQLIELFYNTYCQIVYVETPFAKVSDVSPTLREFIEAVYNVYMEGFFLWQGNTPHDYPFGYFQFTEHDFTNFMSNKLWQHEGQDDFIFIVMETLIPDSCHFTSVFNELNETSMNQTLQYILQEYKNVKCSESAKPYTEIFSMTPTKQGVYQLDRFNVKLRLFPILISDTNHFWIAIPPVFKQEYLLPFNETTLGQQYRSKEDPSVCYQVNNRRIVSNKQMQNEHLLSLSYREMDQDEITCTESLLFHDGLLGQLSKDLVEGFQSYYDSNNLLLPKGLYPMTIDVVVNAKKIYLLDVNYGGIYGVHGPAISLLLLTDLLPSLKHEGIIETKDTDQIYYKEWKQIYYTRKTRLVPPQQCKRKHQRIQETEQTNLDAIRQGRLSKYRMVKAKAETYAMMCLQRIQEKESQVQGREKLQLMERRQRLPPQPDPMELDRGLERSFKNIPQQKQELEPKPKHKKTFF